MLRDVLRPNLNVVFCGTAKGAASAKKGYYYAGPGNKFYGILFEAGFTPERLKPTDCYRVNDFGIGLTDLVQTEFGNDRDIHEESYDIIAFKEKMLTYRPRFVAFNGKTSASFYMGFKGITSLVDYGLQNYTIGTAKVFVLPSTSGSARRFWEEGYWIELQRLILELKQ